MERRPAESLLPAFLNDSSDSAEAADYSDDCEPRGKDGKRVRGHHNAADGWTNRGIGESAINPVNCSDLDVDAPRSVCESGGDGEIVECCALDIRENPSRRDNLCDAIGAWLKTTCRS